MTLGLYLLAAAIILAVALLVVRPLGHQDEHGCPCGEAWPRDPVYELACRLYVEHFTVRYLDEINVPPRRAMVSACRPADSPWRALAVLAIRYCGGVL